MPQRRVSVKQMKRDPLRDALNIVKDWLTGQEALVKQTAAVAVVVLVAGLSIYYFISYRRSSAERAYSAAYEIYTAPVGETNTTYAPLFFTKDEEKYQKAADAFKQVADKYTSSYGDTANFMAASSYLRFDEQKARPILEGLSQKDSQVGRLASMSLASVYRDAGEYDKASALLKKLTEKPGDLPVISIKFQLGQIQLAAGHKDDAGNTFFEVASIDRNASEGQKALELLGDIDPAKALKVPPASPKL